MGFWGTPGALQQKGTAQFYLGSEKFWKGSETTTQYTYKIRRLRPIYFCIANASSPRILEHDTTGKGGNGARDGPKGPVVPSGNGLSSGRKIPPRGATVARGKVFLLALGHHVKNERSRWETSTKRAHSEVIVTKIWKIFAYLKKGTILLIELLHVMLTPRPFQNDRSKFSFKSLTSRGSRLRENRQSKYKLNVYFYTRPSHENSLY